MQYKISVTGVDENADRLEKMGDRATHARDAFERIVDALIEGEQVLWSRNGGGGRNRWQPNTPSTLASKIAKGLDHRVMRASGKLERALTHDRAPGQIRDIDNDSLEFGTSIFYAQFSQNAANPKRRRKILTIMPKTKKNVRTIVLEHITEGS